MKLYQPWALVVVVLITVLLDALQQYRPTRQAGIAIVYSVVVQVVELHAPDGSRAGRIHNPVSEVLVRNIATSEVDGVGPSPGRNSLGPSRPGQLTDLVRARGEVVEDIRAV